MKFEDLNISKPTLLALEKMRYTEPTEVQQKVIPLIINGKNILARSKTGTGKTAAFGVGIIERLGASSAKKALVLAPTRELTVQVSREISKIAENYPLRIVTVYGGYSINPQIDELRRGVDILVATPGRLLDHSMRGTVDLSQFDLVVLDEADRMLDMGFRDEMDRVMKLIPDERTVLLLSATLDQSIMDAASRYMTLPEIIEVGEKEKPPEIKEEHVEASKYEKFGKLLEVLRSHPTSKIIIFASTKYFTNLLADKLMRNGFTADRLQGDMSQAARERVLAKFKQNRIKILVATDVAARGLHIDDIELVINYDQAIDADTHLHRVGRTGRMGSEGKAITFEERAEEAHERYSEDHPDFAWMKRGGGFPSSRPRRGPSSYPQRTSRPQARGPRDYSRRPGKFKGKPRKNPRDRDKKHF
jgi:ATP-dependent RNA helicase DeaD